MKRVVSAFSQTVVPGFWKVVFWFWAFIVTAGFIATPFGHPDVADFVWLIVGAISLVPLYGFAYQIAIGSKAIAALIFLVNLPLVCLELSHAVWLIFIAPGATQAFFSILGITLLLLFMYPLYAYSFRSSHIWGRYT